MGLEIVILIGVCGGIWWEDVLPMPILIKDAPTEITLVYLIKVPIETLQLDPFFNKLIIPKILFLLSIKIEVEPIPIMLETDDNIS